MERLNLLREKSVSRQVIIATNNQNKLAEIKKIFSQLLPNLTVVTLKDINFDQDIEEFGVSFYQNALIKVETIANLYPQAIIIADDSGLEVSALNQQPGVYSARYAMDEPRYSENKDLCNNYKLMRELAQADNRSACFKTVLAIKIPGQEPLFVSGQVDGIILEQMQGESGFGYDPLFSIDGKTSFANLTSREKNQVSHRARALQALAKLKIWQEL